MGSPVRPRLGKGRRPAVVHGVLRVASTWSTKGSKYRELPLAPLVPDPKYSSSRPALTCGPWWWQCGRGKAEHQPPPNGPVPL